MNGDLGALRFELAEARENLALILERKVQYVLRTDVPLRLIKEERHLTKRVRTLEEEIDQARPIELLRRATKLLTERVARAVDGAPSEWRRPKRNGAPWETLKRQLLTQASRLPMERYLDPAALERAAEDLAR